MIRSLILIAVDAKLAALLIKPMSLTHHEVKSSSLGWWLPGDTRRISTSDINRITYKNNTKGALEWAGLGALTGVSRGTTEDGKPFIVVPKYIYESKFREE